jgi:hypothetical protein
VQEGDRASTNNWLDRAWPKYERRAGIRCFPPSADTTEVPNGEPGISGRFVIGRESCAAPPAGYHVDVPAYRRVIVSGEGTDYEESIYELAGTDWKRSDARDVTEWFENENARQSPDKSNGRQLRRITRENKKYARSRSSWDGLILGGFGITTLVVECYKANVDREDKALYDTMKAIRDRLERSLSIKHPVTRNETITSDPDDSKARVLKEKLTDALEWLAPLFDSDCDRKKALKCWDKVFATTFFIDRYDEDDEENATASSSQARSFLATSTRPDAVRKQGGGRYA